MIVNDCGKNCVKRQKKSEVKGMIAASAARLCKEMVAMDIVVSFCADILQDILLDK
ncbi:MAG: hypothetical protein LBD10_09205 [Desulfobulbus sp.]|uniref:hypothetical protein n=1 Tax=Desulfobulbus sp. TaxID=895 RepID=UPI002842BDCB|nr:hypothetical protein [Desulfobulbus sp.]MDR2550359.1 hypothetical protein [Desulfobulbus sp.]